MSPLHLYKASAGSGKTYALTLEYLKLIFNSPDAYRQILAVTFTNKAAGEMKERILARLYALSNSDPSDGNEERRQLMKETGLDAGEIIHRAGRMLNTILNDYSGFSVGTIDKFFQSVIRAFTREIGIQPGYNLELDHQRILSMGVDQLFQEIGDDTGLRQWLIRYAEERLEESRSWNFRDDIVALGMQLFSESFQELYTDPELTMLSKENLDSFLSELGQIEKGARTAMMEEGRGALEHINKGGVAVEDFKLKGNSPPSLFRQAAEEGEVRFTDSKLGALTEPGKWLNKGAAGGMVSLTENVLMPMLNRVYGQQVMLNTIRAIRYNFYTLGILGDIRRKVQEYQKEHNLFLIADSSRFLRGIIGGNQVPFIYEKTGNRYSHIMLDEFQDTSVFQYENFKPLLDNSLASGNENLVVGDVKQSIYRWRNSDWKILASDLQSDFSHQELQVLTLGDNYRSREEVVRFNNTVFQLVPEYLSGVIENELYKASVNSSEAERAVGRFKNVYTDAVQQIPPGSDRSGGFVKIGLFGQEEGLSFREQVLEKIPAWIDEILQSGLEPGDIAILVRTRREGVLVAEKLLSHARITGESHKYRLISSESLLLVHNEAVSMMVAALRYLVSPGDEINNALLKYRCYQAGIVAGERTDSLFDVSVSPDRYLPDEFVSRIGEFRQLPLFELIETLISLLDLNRQESDLPYIQAFQEMIIELQRRDPVGIAEFLQYWEQHAFKTGVRSSEHANAIRILTIHRAKGLEFRAVLVPFLNWEITTDQRKSNILWCRTEGTPFSRISTLPVKFSSSMKHTLFSDFYYQERMKGYLDSLNLMYVALTRAVDILYLGIPEKEVKEVKTTGDLLPAIMEMEPARQPALEPLIRYRTGNEITIGQLPEYTKEAHAKDSWQFTQYHTGPGKRRLKLRMRTDHYFADEEGLFRTGQGFGNMMHMVFSRISTAVDLPPVLDALQKEGVLTSRERPRLQEKITEMISRPGVREWFSAEEGERIYNERTILCGNGKVIRPDRVIEKGRAVTVIDFKFGQIEKKGYLDQVRNYMEQLKGMKYDKVEGAIWYVMLGKTIQIEAI
ncbi:MAG: UvrD-helicase domain-containing protein [Bacteroidota bacterium]